MQIRQYRHHDKDAVWTLHNLALEDSGAHAGNGTWDDDLHHIESVYLAKGGEFLVGILDKQLICMGAILPLVESRTGKGHSKGEIKRMRVHPNHQRRGYGQTMLTHLEARAQQLGYHELILETTTLQHGAQRLYEHNGYIRNGDRQQGPFHVLRYQKYLPDSSHI